MMGVENPARQECCQSEVINSCVNPLVWVWEHVVYTWGDSKGGGSWEAADPPSLFTILDYSGTSLKGLSELRTYTKNLPIKDKFYSPNGTMLIHFYL